MFLLASIATFPRHQPSPDIVLGSAVGRPEHDYEPRRRAGGFLTGRR